MDYRLIMVCRNVNVIHSKERKRVWRLKAQIAANIIYQMYIYIWNNSFSYFLFNLNNVISFTKKKKKKKKRMDEKELRKVNWINPTETSLFEHLKKNKRNDVLHEKKDINNRWFINKTVQCFTIQWWFNSVWFIF